MRVGSSLSSVYSFLIFFFFLDGGMEVLFDAEVAEGKRAGRLQLTPSHMVWSPREGGVPLHLPYSHIDTHKQTKAGNNMVKLRLIMKPVEGASKSYTFDFMSQTTDESLALASRDRVRDTLLQCLARIHSPAPAVQASQPAPAAAAPEAPTPASLDGLTEAERDVCEAELKSNEELRSLYNSVRLPVGFCS